MPLARKAQDTLTDVPTLDMTPMIDVVFQLLIFFMIAIDLSQTDLSELSLPLSDSATKDEPEEGRLYVNVMRDGTYELKRQTYSLEAIQSRLSTLVEVPLKDGKPARDEEGLAARPILIRADQAAEFRHVQRIMYVCGLKDLRIWKVNLAAGQSMSGAVDAPAPSPAK